MMSEMPEKIYVSLHNEYDEPIDLEMEMPTEFTTVPYEGPNWVYIRADLVPQWQPIETAPKDGNYIDVYSENGRLTDVINLNGKFIKWGIDDFESAGWISVKELITHWMPSPKGPNDE